MKRKHPVKIKPNQHRGGLVGSVLRPASLVLMPVSTSLRELCGQLSQRPPAQGRLGPREAPLPESWDGTIQRFDSVEIKQILRGKIKTHPVTLLQNIVMVYVT